MRGVATGVQTTKSSHELVLDRLSPEMLLSLRLLWQSVNSDVTTGSEHDLEGGSRGRRRTRNDERRQRAWLVGDDECGGRQCLGCWHYYSPS